MRTLRITAAFLLAVGPALSGVFAQGTAFTYQGRLNQDGGPATGVFDLRFTIYDAASGSGLVAGPLLQSGVGITNGLFMATLDFGANIFTGPGRWLEIMARTNGAATFTALTPRQPLLPTPYAIHSGTASNVAGGSVVKSLNNLRDNVTLAAGANVTLATNSNTLTISSTGPTGTIWSLSGANTFYNAGNVGVGTPTPDYRLDVGGRMRVRGAGGSGGGIFFTESGTPTSDVSFFGRGADDQNWTGLYSTDWRFVVTDSGNVGIGTANPLSKLHLFEAAGSVTHLLQSGGGVNAWAKVAFNNPNGQWDIATSRGFNNDVFYIDRLGNSSLEFQLSTSGLLGLGIEPQAKLHLYEPNNSVSQRIQTGGGVNAWTRLEFINGNGQWDIGTSREFIGDQFYIHRVGTPGITFGIQPNGDATLQGTLTCKVLTITGGADLAEPFQMSEEAIPKGAVVVIDEENPGHLKMSAEAYDKHVAGVVSGANGIKPGISLQQEGALEGGENVALSGRVYVQADATHGSIKPGDLLTTSSTPGHAMKVTDHTKAQGAILGKAMTGLKEGCGTVLILVTLQ